MLQDIEQVAWLDVEDDLFEPDAAREWLVCPGGALRCAGCEDATQPRTVDKARRRIVEAMDMFVADARRARIIDDVKLPSGAAKALRTYATLRKSADDEERRAA